MSNVAVFMSFVVCRQLIAVLQVLPRVILAGECLRSYVFVSYLFAANTLLSALGVLASFRPRVFFVACLDSYCSNSCMFVVVSFFEVDHTAGFDFELSRTAGGRDRQYMLSQRSVAVFVSSPSPQFPPSRTKALISSAGLVCCLLVRRFIGCWLVASSLALLIGLFWCFITWDEVPS